MQYSIVKFSAIDLGNRIDAEYFMPKYLKEDSLLAKYGQINVGDCAFVTDGQHGYHEVDTNSPISHLTAKNALHWFANLDGADRIAKWVDDKNKRSSLVEGDLILSTRGTVGFCAFVTREVLPANIDQDVARIAIDKELIIPEYVLSYLNCKFGQDWLKRNTSGMVQQGLSLQKVRMLPIPVLDRAFQNHIKHTITSAYNIKNESNLKYHQAQTLLLSELGLLDWKPKHRLSFVKNYSDTQQAGRFDAEYYQPKYDEIVAAIKNYAGGWDTLGNLVFLKKCIEVGSDEYSDEGIPFVRVSNLSPFEITEEKYISEKLYSELTPEETGVTFEMSKNHQPKKGEILFSKDATPGIAYFLSEEPQKMIPSGGILRLKLKDKRIKPSYLTLVLNSLIVQEQINRDVGGSVILHWRPDQLEKTLIPILKEDKQDQIQQKITESFYLRKQSKHLLECAKKAVEMAIEKDEETAMQWLESEIDSIERGN